VVLSRFDRYAYRTAERPGVARRFLRTRGGRIVAEGGSAGTLDVARNQRALVTPEGSDAGLEMPSPANGLAHS